MTETPNPPLRFIDCAHLVRSTAQPSSVDPDTPYIGLEHIGQGSLQLIGNARAADADSQKAVFKKGDILFGKLRPYFRKAVIAPFDGICSTDIWVVRPKGETDRNFLFYWMASQDFVDKATGASDGTRMPRANWEYVSQFELPYMRLDEQKEVGALLRALDEKAELLHQQNETLEAMARGIFKSWFVDFDPVRAKAEGRTPEGMDAATAALFPSTFTESPLGPIPEGWSIESLAYYCDLQNGFAFKSADWQEAGVPVVKIGSVKPGVVDLSNVSYVSDQVADKASNFRLSVGDLLVGLTGYVGETGLIPPTSNLPLLNQRVARFKPRRCQGLSPFIYCVARQQEFKAFAEENAHGSAQPNVSTASLLKFPVIVADSDAVVGEFDQWVIPLMKKILINYEEIASLADLRDTLLPRLISGKLRLTDATAIVEDAA